MAPNTGLRIGMTIIVGLRIPLVGRDHVDWPPFLTRVRRQDYPPSTRLWGMLTAGLRKRLNSTPPGAAVIDELVGELNGLLSRRDFYDEQAWAGVAMRDGTHPDGPAGLSGDEMVRFNLLALSSAFPEIIVRGCAHTPRD